VVRAPKTGREGEEGSGNEEGGYGEEYEMEEALKGRRGFT
jgi:hypothetical protein